MTSPSNNMRPIVPMTDLAAEYRDLKPEIDAAIRRVVESGSFVMGVGGRSVSRPSLPAIAARSMPVGVGSGTAALHLALLACGIGPGDEVITVPNSDLPSSMVISHCGAKIVWVDVDPRDPHHQPRVDRGRDHPGHAGDHAGAPPRSPCGHGPDPGDRAAARAAGHRGRGAGHRGGVQGPQDGRSRRRGLLQPGAGQDLWAPMVTPGWLLPAVVRWRIASECCATTALRSKWKARWAGRSAFGIGGWSQRGSTSAWIPFRRPSCGPRCRLWKAASPAAARRRPSIRGLLAGLDLKLPVEADFARHVYRAYLIMVADRDPRPRPPGRTWGRHRVYYSPPLPCSRSTPTWGSDLAPSPRPSGRASRWWACRSSLRSRISRSSWLSTPLRECVPGRP